MELQWGRAHLSDGNFQDSGNIRSDDHASKGPRPFERGNRDGLDRQDCLLVASIGPRSFKRGNWVMGNFNLDYVMLQWSRALSSAEACWHGAV